MGKYNNLLGISEYFPDIKLSYDKKIEFFEKNISEFVHLEKKLRTIFPKVLLGFMKRIIFAIYSRDTSYIKRIHRDGLPSISSLRLHQIRMRPKI
jgi:hypothetical protein